MNHKLYYGDSHRIGMRQKPDIRILSIRSIFIHSNISKGI